MPHPEPLHTTDRTAEPENLLEMQSFELSDDDLAELDRRDEDAMVDLAANRLTSLDDVLTDLCQQRDTRLAG